MAGIYLAIVGLLSLRYSITFDVGIHHSLLVITYVLLASQNRTIDLLVRKS